MIIAIVSIRFQLVLVVYLANTMFLLNCYIELSPIVFRSISVLRLQTNETKTLVESGKQNTMVSYYRFFKISRRSSTLFLAMSSKARDLLTASKCLKMKSMHRLLKLLA